MSKKPTLICALTLRGRPAPPDGPLWPMQSYGVRREELGTAGVSFTVYLLFADGQGEWPVEVNLLTIDGKKSGRPLAATVVMEDALSIAPVAIETGIRISRFGYNWITVDLDGETVARVPFHVFELDSEGESI